MLPFNYIASICNDNEIDKFPDLKQVVPEIVSLIVKCAKNIKSGKSSIRFKVQLDENKDEVHDVCKIEVNCRANFKLSY